MAATKLFPITATEVKALKYISDFQKTENGKHIFTYMCSRDPVRASHNFELTRMNGTGLNTILSQHLIQAFAPNEVTPEEAMLITNELCEKLYNKKNTKITSFLFALLSYFNRRDLIISQLLPLDKSILDI